MAAGKPPGGGGGSGKPPGGGGSVGGGGSGMPPGVGGGGSGGGGGTQPVAPCAAGQTKCCGDGVCDGPETPTSCAADCKSARADGSSGTSIPPAPKASGASRLVVSATLLIFSAAALACI